MNEVQNILDSLQQAVASIGQTWSQLSELVGSIAGGSQTIGSIVLGVAILAFGALAVYIGSTVFGG